MISCVINFTFYGLKQYSFAFQNNNLTWNTESPSLTPCFEKTVLLWIPFGFLWLFSSIDAYYTFTSKTRNIPSNWRNRAKLVSQSNNSLA